MQLTLSIGWPKAIGLTLKTRGAIFMVIYLQHPKHGNKVAIAESEAIADEKNGWIRYNLNTPETPVLDAAPIENQLEVKRKYNRRT